MPTIKTLLCLETVQKMASVSFRGLMPLGAAAGLCGITDLTVTVVIIMFELTGALRYIIPTMIVVAITKSINDKWGKGGIADQMIKFNGLPLIDSKEVFTLALLLRAQCLLLLYHSRPI